MSSSSGLPVEQYVCVSDRCVSVAVASRLRSALLSRNVGASHCVEDLTVGDSFVVSVCTFCHNLRFEWDEYTDDSRS